MKNSISKSFFIIGTDTDIGKTYISSLLFKSLLPGKIGYYKPLQTGCYKESNHFVPLDPKFLCDFNNIQLKDEMTSFLFENPVSPHLASEIENIPISKEKIIKDYTHIKDSYDISIVEAAGGIYVPIIRNTYYMFDLVHDLNIPIILVCSSKVGAINHTMLTIEFLKQKNLSIQGIIFNNYTDEFYEKDNIKVVLESSGIKNYLVVKKDQQIIEKDSITKFLNI